MIAGYDSDLCSVESVVEMMNRADPGSVPAYAQAEYASLFALLKSLIPQASRQLKTLTGRNFVPYRATHALFFSDLVMDRKVAGRTIPLPDDLLVLDDLVWDGVLLLSDDYRLLPTYKLPATMVRLLSKANVRWPAEEDAALEIRGVWGYHERWEQAWATVEALSGPLSAGATVIGVADVDAYGILDYLRVDDEYMQVVGKITTPASIEVARGVNGTVAAAHGAGASVMVWRVMQDVAFAAQRLVVHAYQSRGGVGNMQLPDGAYGVPNVLPEVTRVMKHYVRVSALAV